MQHVFKFLKKIKLHNNRDWFEANKSEYLKAKEEYEVFIDKLILGLRKFDKKIDPSLTGKQCAFRIYKDVRFSKDKTPYKSNMGASINPGGKKSPIAGYYFHAEPCKSFIAGGVWMPEPEVLNKIRQEIDYNSKPLLKIISAPKFKKYFGDFIEDGKLKTAPKGYEKDHELIEILKNRNFIVLHYFSDKEILGSNSQKLVLDGIKQMHPLMEFLRTAQN